MPQQSINYFAAQKNIYVKSIKGFFRTLKWIILWIALLVYYLVPWIRWDRGDNLPNQAVLIDMFKGRAYFFGLEIWPQEIYYITALLIIAAVGLFLITSLLGRVWCGYFCFQTIWTDLFIFVEKVFQGDRNARMKLDKEPLSFNKIWRKALTHITWVIIGLMTGGAWVFYFNDAPTLMGQILDFTVPWSVMMWILSLTASTYIMAGFAREQVCTYMCPYARFQSAMFDENTMIIGYDNRIAEPRGHYKKGDPLDNRGYCIDCTACVQVCPMGIDIRDGLQMECIACGLCIDACDDIMQKVGFDAKLIRYDNYKNLTSNKPQKFNYKMFLRPRTFYYSAIMIIAIAIVLYSMLNRTEISMNIIHDRNPLFVKLSNGNIRNGYDIHILNKSHQDKTYKIHVSNLENSEIKLQAVGQIDNNNILALSNSVNHYRVFITAPVQNNLNHEISLNLVDKNNNSVISQETVFMSKE